MSKKPADTFEYLSNDPDFVPNPEIEEFMEEEIARAPKDPDQLAHRLRNNTAASPKDAGGDPAAILGAAALEPRVAPTIERGTHEGREFEVIAAGGLRPLAELVSESIPSDRLRKLIADITSTRK